MIVVEILQCIFSHKSYFHRIGCGIRHKMWITVINFCFGRNCLAIGKHHGQQITLYKGTDIVEKLFVMAVYLRNLTVITYKWKTVPV